jgi:hypothetical protein
MNAYIDYVSKSIMTLSNFFGQRLFTSITPSPMNNKPMKHDQIHNIPSQSLYLQATMTILPQNRVRLIAIPVFLCASWFLDFTKLIDSLGVETTQGTHHVRKKSNPIRIDNNNKTAMPSLFQDGIHNAAEQALHTVSVDDEQNLRNKKPVSWYDTNTAVQELEKALSESLTLEERQLWHDTPNFHPFPKRISCPSPKPFVSSNVPITLLDFTDEQKDTLRQQLEQGSSTIRKAFAPWIEKEGFHPDLILHGGKVAGLMVGILDGKLYFWGDKHSHAKIRLLAEHLESVLYEFHKRNVQIPDVMFPYSVRSIPPDSLTKNCARRSAVPSHLQDRYDAVPVAGIAMDPTIHTGIALMPNMYFGNLQVWDRYTKELLGKLNTPWNKRKKRVFWRGKIDKNLYHNAPRLEALQAAARDLQSSNGKNRNFDVRLTSGCGYLKNFAKNVTRTSPLAPKWLPRDYFIKVTECGGYTRTPHAKFPNYWAQLNLPGSSLGSYSKNLQNLWPMGAGMYLCCDAASIRSILCNLTHTPSLSFFSCHDLEPIGSRILL